MLVHIVLKKPVREKIREDAEFMGSLIAKVTELGMRDINTKRLQRYGILTGNILEDKVSLFRDLEGTEELQVDGTKSAS